MGAGREGTGGGGGGTVHDRATGKGLEHGGAGCDEEAGAVVVMYCLV